jgi:hypothetical protein
MANPRYNQPERQSGRERRLSELGSLLQMSNSAQGPALEQQQLQQREQAGRQNMMMQFMQMMQQQQEAKQRMQQGQGQLDLGREELGQRRTEATGRQQQADLGVLGALGEHGDASALKALGMRIPEYGQAMEQGHQAEVQKGVAGTLPAIQALYNKGGSDLPKALGGLQPGINPDVWNAIPWDQLNQGMSAPQAPQGIPPALEPILNALTMGNFNTVKQLPGVMQHPPSLPPQGINPQFDQQKQAAMARAMQKLMSANGIQ